MWNFKCPFFSSTIWSIKNIPLSSWKCSTVEVWCVSTSKNKILFYFWKNCHQNVTFMTKHHWNYSSSHKNFYLVSWHFRYFRQYHLHLLNYFIIFKLKIKINKNHDLFWAYRRRSNFLLLPLTLHPILKRNKKFNVNSSNSKIFLCHWYIG